jgi:nitronate monooxygenase
VIRTRITEMFGLQYPIISAPMALHSGGTLAAAVSVAGGWARSAGCNRSPAPNGWTSR